MIWVFRALVVAACPLLVYFTITPSADGVVVGLCAGLSIVLIEVLIVHTDLLVVISSALGASVGIILAKLTDYIVFQIGSNHLYKEWDKYAALRYFSFGILGLLVALRKFPEFGDLDQDILKRGRRRGADIKILDAGAVIDGRILDICDAKFLSGSMVVPRFVIHELHSLSESPDPLKKARGRRGLDTLARLQENADPPLKIIDRDVPAVSDLEGKVVRLAKDLGAKVITTDFDLNKIAALENVVCLNINDLSTALKPVALPGEPMSVYLMKEGKEKDQGVGYLDDGTMVVVEDGRRHIGKRIDVHVASILQTSAGRMIFAKPRTDKDKREAPEAEAAG